MKEELQLTQHPMDQISYVRHTHTLVLHHLITACHNWPRSENGSPRKRLQFMKDSSSVLLKFAQFKAQWYTVIDWTQAQVERIGGISPSVYKVDDKTPRHSFTLFFFLKQPHHYQHSDIFFLREDEGSSRDLYKSLFSRIQGDSEKGEKRLNTFGGRVVFNQRQNPTECQTGHQSKEISAPFHYIESRVRMYRK